MKRYNLEEKQSYQGLSMWLNSDGEYCLYDDVEKLEAENKKLREALIKTNKVLHDLSYDDSSCFHKVTRIVEEALEDTK